jgi:hypothetical protein
VLLGSNWLEPGELSAQLMYALEPLAHRQRAIAFSASSGRFELLGDVVTFIRSSRTVGHTTSVNGHGCILRNLVCSI